MVRRLSSLVLLVLLLGLAACSIPDPLTRTPESLPNAEMTYTVQPGDTLSKIALQFNSTVEQLIALNRGDYPTLARDPSRLAAGWKLRVPNPEASARVTPTNNTDLPNSDLHTASQLIVDGTNTARGQNGLVLLRTDLVLNRVARDRSTDMVLRNYFSHHDPETGQEPLLQNLRAAGYVYQYAGENLAEMKNDAGWVPPLLSVAARYSSSDLATEFVKGWLASPEHRDNILNSHYRRTGVALGVSADGRRIVATQVFSD